MQLQDEILIMRIIIEKIYFWTPLTPYLLFYFQVQKSFCKLDGFYLENIKH